MTLPVAVLAGGLARRMRPVTESIPKSLLEVAGRPFIVHQLELLSERGIRRVVLCLGHLGEMVEKEVGTGARFGLRVAYAYDGEPLLGTAGALRAARHLLGETFFVLYGDSYLDIDYGAVERAFAASGACGLMTVHHNRNRWDRSNVHLEDGRIVRYSKEHPDPRMEHIDFGLGILTGRALDEVPAGQPYDLATLYERLIERGQLAGCEVSQRFYEIGSFEGLQETDAYLRQRGSLTP